MYSNSNIHPFCLSLTTVIVSFGSCRAILHSTHRGRILLVCTHRQAPPKQRQAKTIRGFEQH
uniref:Uncharacterized protein n=1 Tax=Anguilla anguilla TaxID=7936 RepID=A0A0E9WDV7_ANGAN